MPPNICLDFDGVLATYRGYAGRGKFGRPMPGVKSFLEKLDKAGISFIVLTTRTETKLIRHWFERFKLPLPAKITNKKVSATAYVDDRAIHFDGSFEQLLKELSEFAPHWQKKKPFKDCLHSPSK